MLSTQEQIKKLNTNNNNTIIIEHIASYILEKTNKVTPLKLQKILHYTCAIYYTIYDSHVGNEEIEFQAWPHGPINRHVYNLCSDYTKNTILDSTTSLEGLDDYSILTVNELKFIDMIIDAYGGMSGTRLEIFACSEKHWVEKREGLTETSPSTDVISYEKMKEYYGEKMQR